MPCSSVDGCQYSLFVRKLLPVSWGSKWLWCCVTHDCSKHTEQHVKLPSLLHDITVLVHVVETTGHTQVISVMSVYSEFYILKYFLMCSIDILKFDVRVSVHNWHTVFDCFSLDFFSWEKIFSRGLYGFLITLCLILNNHEKITVCSNVQNAVCD